MVETRLYTLTWRDEAGVPHSRHIHATDMREAGAKAQEAEDVMLVFVQELMDEHMGKLRDG